MVQEGDVHPWTDGHICENIIKRRVGAVILHAEAIKLSKVANMATAIVRKETTILNKMKGVGELVLNGLLQLNVSFVDVRIKYLLSMQNPPGSF